MRASDHDAPAAFAAVSASARSSLIGSSSNAATPRGYVGNPEGATVSARPSSGRSIEPVAASAAALPVFLRKSRRVVIGVAMRLLSSRAEREIWSSVRPGQILRFAQDDMFASERQPVAKLSVVQNVY